MTIQLRIILFNSLNEHVNMYVISGRTATELVTKWGVFCLK